MFLVTVEPFFGRVLTQNTKGENFPPNMLGLRLEVAIDKKKKKKKKTPGGRPPGAGGAAPRPPRGARAGGPVFGAFSP